MNARPLWIVLALTAVGWSALAVAASQSDKHEVSREHPRLFGSRQRLLALKQQRSGAYVRMKGLARNGGSDTIGMFSMALVCAIENDANVGRRAIQQAMKYINGPIKRGHVTFGHDLARCAVVYDLCHEYWTDEQRRKFHEYMNKTVDANVRSETHVFHNGYYGYKNWGIGLACYATMYENPRAREILATLHADVLKRALPALEFAGDGGGWAEGHYINYFLLEWLTFCEVARLCEGVDYYALAPKFFAHRAIAAMFEVYPADVRRSFAAIPMGDGGARVGCGHRDKNYAVRRILTSYYRDDPAHQAVQAFNLISPRSLIGNYAYLDFLWGDATVPKGNLKGFKLSHISPGPGYVYARSSWDEDAAYLFFKCGDRFTAHQHLDVGNFLIFKNNLLVGDGGYYDSWTGSHVVNYYLRSIAHNTMLIQDPSERWSVRNTRAANDGGQKFPWGGNGNAMDVADWQGSRKRFDLAEILAYEERGGYMYVAGDCTRAYSSRKLDTFTRQIVFVRPGTFVIFDRVRSKNPNFKKTWLLQAMKTPTGTAPNLVVTNGKGRLFVQTLLPVDPQVKLRQGSDLYRYGGGSYPPGRTLGPIPQCRIEVSPSRPAATDYFLHVLTATDASVASAPRATVETSGGRVEVTVGRAKITFLTGGVGGRIELGGRQADFARKIETQPGPARMAKVKRKGNGRSSARRNGNRGKSAAASAVAQKAQGPTAEEKAAAKKQYDMLKGAIIAGAAAGKRARVYIELAGRLMRAKLLSADEHSIVASAQGLEVPLTWGQLSPKRFYGIACKYTSDHTALYEYCRGFGLTQAAEKEQGLALQ